VYWNISNCCSISYWFEKNTKNTSTDQWNRLAENSNRVWMKNKSELTSAERRHWYQIIRYNLNLIYALSLQPMNVHEKLNGKLNVNQCSYSAEIFARITVTDMTSIRIGTLSELQNIFSFFFVNDNIQVQYSPPFLISKFETYDYLAFLK